MEQLYKNFFYMGIAEEESIQKRTLKKEGLSIEKMDRRLMFPAWEGRRILAYVQLYFSLLPQYEEGLFHKKKSWKPEDIRSIIRQGEMVASDKWECREMICAKELGGKADEIPTELLAAYLYRQRPFDSICICLPEWGDEAARQALWLLSPYLSRMKKIQLLGEENRASDYLATNLYQEFGILAMKKDEPEEGMAVLDLRKEEETEGNQAEQLLWKRKKIRCINRSETLKFLDTTVKNGYNTKVN